MAASVKVSQAGLEKIDQARRSKGWPKTGVAWCHKANISEATLKRFWARKPVQQGAFAAICEAVGIEDWRTIADLAATNARTISTLPPLPGIYHASTWVERISLTETLLPMLQSDRRVIVLTGMTGIGKTALAERLTLPLQDGKSLRRLNLDDGGITADFSSSGAALLRTLGEEPTLEDQKDAKSLLNHILDRLRTRPYRIQVDSLERLLEGNDRQGWSEFCDALWLDLWQQVLAGGECQSQIILTTQDVPGELEAIGSRYPQLWHCQPIRGLSEAEQLQLFQNHDIVAACNVNAEAHNINAEGQHVNAETRNANAEADNANATTCNANAEGQHRIATAHNDAEANSAVSLLKRIGKLYEGHPLVLRVIAEDIKTCGGDVQRYWQKCRFEELEANRPAKFSRPKLQSEVNHWVRKSLQRLPDDARQLLCRSAVYRRPVPESFWLAMLPERTETQQQAALNLLKSRTFAEEDWKLEAWLGADGEIPLRQHNLIRSVAYDLLRQDFTIWETAERQATQQWLTIYQPAPEAPNLEKVRGQIEAFHHFCELANWDAAKTILLDQKLGTGLQNWGYYRETILLYGRLTGRLSVSNEVVCKGGLGNAYLYLSNYDQAKDYHQQSLALAREIGDRQGESKALGNLGLVYHDLSNYKQAVTHHEQALAIACEIDDRRWKGRCLGNLGIIYRNLGNYKQAIDYHQQALAITREIGDRQWEGGCLGNLGNAQYNLGNYEQAIDYHQQCLFLAREVGDRWMEGTALGNIGLTYDSLGSYRQAIDFYQQHLTLAREIGNQLGEGRVLGNIGVAYYNLGNYEQAINHHRRYLTIAHTIGDRWGEGIALGNLGSVYCALGNYSKAIELQNQKLTIVREMDDRVSESYALSGLGEVLIKLEQYAEALEALQAALMICGDTGERSLEAKVLKNLAELHQKTGSIASGRRSANDLAQQYCDRALALAIELGIPLAEECRSLRSELNKEVNCDE